MSNTSLQIDAPVAQRTSVISALTKGELCPAPIWQRRSYRLKFFLRALLYWPSTTRMLDALSRREDFLRLLKAQKTLPSKTHRQYLVRNLSPADRAEAIVHHYAWVDSLPGVTLASAFTSPTQQPILHFHARDEARYTIYAAAARTAEREGEATLWLRDENDTLLASVTFCVVKQNGHYALAIGGLQGTLREVSRDVIKNATRACHGLFPKRILMETVFSLAEQSDIKALYGVSNEGHVFRALRYRLSKGKVFHASYDEFWKSLDGKPCSSLLWQLPLRMERKSLESIASKKRAEYRRRFQLLDEVAQGVNAHFAR